MFTQEQINYVSAGVVANNIVEALSIAIKIYESSSLLIDASNPSLVQSTQNYAKLGSKLGEELFNIAHPNPLGKMIYYAQDFQGEGS